MEDQRFAVGAVDGFMYFAYKIALTYNKTIDTYTHGYQQIAYKSGYSVVCIKIYFNDYTLLSYWKFLFIS